MYAVPYRSVDRGRSVPTMIRAIKTQLDLCTILEKISVRIKEVLRLSGSTWRRLRLRIYVDVAYRLYYYVCTIPNQLNFHHRNLQIRFPKSRLTENINGGHFYVYLSVSNENSTTVTRVKIISGRARCTNVMRKFKAHLFRLFNLTKRSIKNILKRRLNTHISKVTTNLDEKNPALL